MSKDEVGKEGQYQKVANKSELQEGSMIKVQPNGKQIVLSMVEGKVYAIFLLRSMHTPLYIMICNF
jgi:hypothetical protein